MTDTTWVDADLDAMRDDLHALYRDLHANPELSFSEHRTAGILAQRLLHLGLEEVTTGIGGTGVVGFLRNGAGPTVLLRADMDGLPVLEDTGLRLCEHGPRHRPRWRGCAGDARLRS